ncbi:MAG TPA: hypothetical protein VK426_09000 [Methanobacterium sp.]|nr:hypothetical protein [Methanobacterium sp.]
MISITEITTTLNIGQINNIIIVGFFLVIFSVRNIMAGMDEKRYHTRTLLQNLNLVSIPLLIIVTTVLFYDLFL